MLCPLRAAETTSNELKLLMATYGLTLEELLRDSLDFVDLVMPGELDSVSLSASSSLSSAPSPAAPAVEHACASSVLGHVSDNAAHGAAKCAAHSTASVPPDFLVDFCHAVLPMHRMRTEIHRVSAILEETVLHVRAQRLRIEAFGSASQAVAVRRKIDTYMDPATTVHEEDQYVMLPTLGLLEAVKELQRKRTPVLASCVPVVGLDLAGSPSSAWDEAKRRSLALTKGDVTRWLLLLKKYGWVRPELTIGWPLRAEDADVIVAGFARFLSSLAEAVCFIFAVTEQLPRKVFREDLLTIHLRARQNSQALKQGRH